MELEQVIDELVRQGCEAVERDYARPDQEQKRLGSLAGFKACLGLDLDGLRNLLAVSKENREAARLDPARRERYWYFRCMECEIEWVCNCISVSLHQAGLPVIVPPTARALLHMDKVLRALQEEPDAT